MKLIKKHTNRQTNDEKFRAICAKQTGGVSLAESHLGQSAGRRFRRLDQFLRLPAAFRRAVDEQLVIGNFHVTLLDEGEEVVGGNLDVGKLTQSDETTPRNEDKARGREMRG